MAMRNRNFGRLLCVAGALTLTLTGLMGAVTLPAQAQRGKMTTSPKQPNNVLIFPADITGAGAEMTKAQKDVQDIVTDAVARKLRDAGVGFYVYSKRLPSVQRAVSEALIKQDNAMGPKDDDALAMKLADISGATEYVTVTVDDYKYDTATRTVTFSLSLIRKYTADGTSLGTVSEKATGSAPEDVAIPLQEGSAVARAASVVAEQVVGPLYPLPKIADKDMKKMKK